MSQQLNNSDDNGKTLVSGKAAKDNLAGHNSLFLINNEASEQLFQNKGDFPAKNADSILASEACVNAIELDAHNKDEDEEVEEEVITQSSPPTEIVDTVVTTTTNPDGSLKRTTRKTTRTLQTTTRIRRIKHSSPINVEHLSPPVSSQTDKSKVQFAQPTMYTVIGSPSTYQDEEGSNQITHAAFTIIPPTSHTEVSYFEDDGGEHNNSLDSVGQTMNLNSETSSETKSKPTDVKNQTKTTVRKTITSSAAAATFVATKKPKPQETSKVPGSDNGTNDTLSSYSSVPTDSGAVTVTKRTTKVVNNLANKSLLFTRASLETLKRSLLGKDHHHDIAANSDMKEHCLIPSDEKMASAEPEQLALLAMSESERLFSEGNLLPSQITTLIPCSATGSPSNSGGQIVDHRFQSIFSNLPLYQGYGLLAQQLSMGNDLEQRTRASTEMMNAKSVSPDQVELLTPLPAWMTGRGLTLSQGIEVAQTTDALVNLLDESTEKLLKEASEYWCKMGYKKFDVVPIGSAGLAEKDINSGSIERPLMLPDESPGATPADEKPNATDSSCQVSAASDTEISQASVSSKTQRNASSLNKVEPCSDASAPREYDRLRLGQLGLSSPGAFRVAWSEMPEVLNSDALQLLTKHEIQLQEAMFEVITSEASYYQSLNVLVKHFYHAPEFCYGPTSAGTAISRTDSAVNPVHSPNSSSHGQSANIANLSTSLPNPVEAGPDVTAPDPAVVSSNTSNIGATGKRPLLKPLEKHHLFSNVLLVCLASEKFLQDLERRWVSQMPIINEVCDLIVKHAGGVTFEPYITYLRNQDYQMETLRKLCQRDSFRSALDALHSHPVSGKHCINSFLALPMQRLTRLKLLVEVIRRLQDTVVKDAMESDESKRPYRVPTDRQRENVQLALGELCRLLACSETEKELMDQKARLLTLSNSLEFPDNVKCIAISDKRLIKEGELREASLDGRMSVLQKLSLKKPNSYYIILFNDMLLVTKRKKNDRYVVLDYCERAAIQAEVQKLGELQHRNFNPQPCGSSQPPVNCPLEPSFIVPPNESVETSNIFSSVQDQSVSGRSRNETLPEQSFPKESFAQKQTLSRSGSSLSAYRVRTRFNSNLVFNVHQSTSSEESGTEIIHLLLTGSHNGTFTELNLIPKDNDVLASWCKAFAINAEPNPKSAENAPQLSDQNCNVKHSTSKSGISQQITSIYRHATLHSTRRHIQSPLLHEPNSSGVRKTSPWFQRARNFYSFRRNSKPAALKKIQNTYSNECISLSPPSNTIASNMDGCIQEELYRGLPSNSKL